MYKYHEYPSGQFQWLSCIDYITYNFDRTILNHFRPHAYARVLYFHVHTKFHLHITVMCTYDILYLFIQGFRYPIS